MTIQGTLFDLPEPTGARGLRWERVTNGLGTCGARYYLLRDNLDTGYWIEHCGHPTANNPYIGIAPGGVVIKAPNGRGFTKLALAQADVGAVYLKGG